MSILELSKSRTMFLQPELPPGRGPISAFLFGALRRPGGSEVALLREPGERVEAAIDAAAPLADDDLHLALYAAYELHYRGFADVDDGWEWDPALIGFRARLEERFMEALGAAIGDQPRTAPEEVGSLLFELERADDGPSLSSFLEHHGTMEQFREFVIHRSAYQLMEADPHSWVIGRLAGAPKTALLEVQSDEYGGGDPERMHSLLFAKTMQGLGLEGRVGAYLDRIPGITLATVNLMSSLGLRRARRGGIVGHLAMFEMTSARPNRAYGNGLRRLGIDDPGVLDFYDEHVEADAVHENIAAYDLAGGLAKAEPGLAEDIIFGAQALLDVENRFARHLLGSWEHGESSLLPRPAADQGAPGNEPAERPIPIPFGV